MNRFKLLALTILSFHFSFAQITPDSTKQSSNGFKLLNLVEMSGNWFISYRNGIEQIHADEETPQQTIRKNEFLLKRSYITLKKDLNKTFSVRYTMDLTIDKEGEDAGNIETRLKFLYVKAKLNFGSPTFTGTYVEAGMVHTPWVDFEQKINTYRVQDNMFTNRDGIFDSADFGFLIAGNIGPKMDKTFLQEVNDAMEGKYMSYALGLYNGGGYAGLEKNSNKVVEGRLSFRPFANQFPQLQFSTTFSYGKGNRATNPDYKQLLGYLAYTGKQLTLATQYHSGTGDFKGKYVDPLDDSIALKNKGISAFGEYKLKNTNWAIWGRYDHFDVSQQDHYDVIRYIGGLTYRINDYLRLVADFERNETIVEDNNIYELNLEISF